VKSANSSISHHICRIHIYGQRSLHEYTNLETKRIQNIHRWLTHYEQDSFATFCQDVLLFFFLLPLQLLQQLQQQQLLLLLPLVTVEQTAQNILCWPTCWSCSDPESWCAVQTSWPDETRHQTVCPAIERSSLLDNCKVILLLLFYR